MNCLRCDKPGHKPRDCKARLADVFKGRFVLDSMRVRSADGGVIKLEKGGTISEKDHDELLAIMGRMLRGEDR